MPSLAARAAAHARRAAVGAVAALGAAALLVLSANAPSEAVSLRQLAPAAGPAAASAARFTPTPEGGLRFEMRLSQPVEHQAFTLERPDRLVVDFPELDWRFDAQTLDLAGAPGVRGVRVGLFRSGRSRLVIDLSGAPRGARVRAAGAAGWFALEFAVAGAPVAAAQRRRAPALARAEARARAAARQAGLSRPFAASLGPALAPALAPAPTRRAAAAADPLAPRRAPAPRPRARPLVVVIDAGHGGGDPGALNHAGGAILEKDVVLDIARRAARRLEGEKTVKIVMTRARDVKVPLPRRVEIAREAGGELFLSIHADSLPKHPEVGGASAYTLETRASDTLAARVAGRRGDVTVAGMEVGDHPRAVREIVVDYVRRTMMASSHDVAGRMISALRGAGVKINGTPHRHDDFHVLRQLEMPAVLVEVGFMTNAEDRARMRRAAWRERVAGALAAAVRDWAARRGPARPTVSAMADAGR